MFILQNPLNKFYQLHRGKKLEDKLERFIKNFHDSKTNHSKKRFVTVKINTN